MMEEVQVRPIAEGDIEAIERHIAFDWAALGKHRERFDRQSGSEAVYLVAWHENLPAGHVFLKWRGSTDEPVVSRISGCPDIEDLFVVPTMRSKGIGSLLVKACEGLARRKRFGKIGLAVDVQNHRARALYERLGYFDTGLGQYEINSMYMDNGNEVSWSETCNYLIKQLD